MREVPVSTRLKLVGYWVVPDHDDTRPKLAEYWVVPDGTHSKLARYRVVPEGTQPCKLEIGCAPMRAKRPVQNLCDRIFI